MALVVLLLAITGPKIEVVDHFDMIEINHLHNVDTCHHVFTQLLCKDWCRLNRRYLVHYWRVVRKNAYDKTNVAHREAWEADKERIADSIRDHQFRQRILGIEYRGEFTGGGMLPKKVAGKYTIRFYDDGVLRVITADSVIETKTQYDPEKLDRQYLPEKDRRGLTRAYESIAFSSSIAIQMEFAWFACNQIAARGYAIYIPA